jgi:hypothetical protein
MYFIYLIRQYSYFVQVIDKFVYSFGLKSVLCEAVRSVVTSNKPLLDDLSLTGCYVTLPIWYLPSFLVIMVSSSSGLRSPIGQVATSQTTWIFIYTAVRTSSPCKPQLVPAQISGTSCICSWLNVLFTPYFNLLVSVRDVFKREQHIIFQESFLDARRPCWRAVYRVMRTVTQSEITILL